MGVPRRETVSISRAREPFDAASISAARRPCAPPKLSVTFAPAARRGAPVEKAPGSSIFLATRSPEAAKRSRGTGRSSSPSSTLFSSPAHLASGPFFCHASLCPRSSVAPSFPAHCKRSTRPVVIYCSLKRSTTDAHFHPRTNSASHTRRCLLYGGGPGVGGSERGANAGSSNGTKLRGVDCFPSLLRPPVEFVR